MTAKTKEQEKAYVLSGIVALATLSILAAVLLFDHSFEKQESHCNDAVCADVIAIASVSFGIISVGNPIGVGVVCVSSFGKSVWLRLAVFFLIIFCSSCDWSRPNCARGHRRSSYWNCFASWLSISCFGRRNLEKGSKLILMFCMYNTQVYIVSYNM